MINLHRAQLLFESEQHRALAEIAEQEGRSISDLIRESGSETTRDGFGECCPEGMGGGRADAARRG